MELLEERKEKGKAETEMKKKQTTPEETDIIVEEVERQIRKLKKRKAPERNLVQKGREKQSIKLPRNNSAKHRQGINCMRQV
jgi:hypothetical protein